MRNTNHLNYWLLIAAIFLGLFPFWTHAGGGPTGFIVVYNPIDPRSVTIANYYQQVRNIPERNMVPYVMPQSGASYAFTRYTAWDMIYSLRQTLAARGLNPQLQGIALAGVLPLSAEQVTPDGYGGYIYSIESLLYLSPNYNEASFPATLQEYNPAYAPSSNFNGTPPTGTIALTASTIFSNQPTASGQATVWPVSCIGFPGRSGNSVKEILGYIDRAKAHDSANPSGGKIYWPLNNDVRSITRQSEIVQVADMWNARGIQSIVTGTANTDQSQNIWVANRTDIQGGVVGRKGFSDQGNTYLPGAWVDHLTSCGGFLDRFIIPDNQTTCSQWLRMGSDGTSGMIAEPYAIPDKFPHANIHTHLRAGASLVEAIWESIAFPAEIFCLGDPLLQAFASFPVVTVSAPTNGASVSGTITIAATATPTGGKTLETNFDLFIDGRRIAIGTAAETVSALRTAGGFSLDTRSLSDGWHDVRVVAYNADAVRTQNEKQFGMTVNNLGQSLILIGTNSVNPSGTASFTLVPSGLTDLASLALQANGRVLANLPVGAGAITISGTNAPLAGNWTLFAVGTRSNGLQVSSPPFTTTISWPALAPTNNPPLGSGMADIRVFNATTNFNWDTSPPSFVTNFPGDPTNGIYLSINNFSPFAAFTNYSSTKPGCEIKFWYYAPADDWYEFGVDGGFWWFQLTVDGQTNNTYSSHVWGVNHLASGWHKVRLRTWIGSASYNYLTILIRGGASQDFIYCDPITTCGMDTNSNPAADAPTISSITPTASPVTGTNVTFTASATIGGGSASELAGLKYYWTVLSAPSNTVFNTPYNGSPTNKVRFSTNGSNGAKVTTVTFIQSGYYNFGLKVSGPAGSSFTNFPILVKQTPSGLSVSGGLISYVLQGMAFDLFAFNKDQFGIRLKSPLTNGIQPNIIWNTTDPTGKFTLLSSNGEEVAYSSASNTIGSFTITATGTNGYSGTGTAPVKVSSNVPPTAVGGHLFTISQTGSGQPIGFTATVSAPAIASGTNNTYVLTYHWAVTSKPLGGSLTFNADGYSQATGTAVGAGIYTVKLTITDSSGASVAESQPLLVDSQGSVFSYPKITVLYSQAGANIGENVDIPQPNYAWVIQWQWQLSTNSGVSWQNIPGATNATLTYGPLMVADNGKMLRVVGSNPIGTATSAPITLYTYSNPTGCTLDLASAHYTVLQSAGAANIAATRFGSNAGAASLTWQIGNGTAMMGTDILPVGGLYTGTLNWASGDSANKSITIPIVNNGVSQNGKYFVVSISNPTGASIGTTNMSFIYIVNTLGQATFTQSAISVNESAGSLPVTISRTGGNTGTLTVTCATRDGSAVAGINYVATNSSLTWTNGENSVKQIVVSILNTNVINTNLQFTVNLSATNSGMLGLVTNLSVMVQPSPYKQWLSSNWPASIPSVPTYNSFRTALQSHNPLFHFRFSETNGNTVNGVNAAGTNVVTGILSNTASGSYTLGYAGPRPTAWSGLETNNYALRFTAGGSNGVPAQFTNGASINCGTANGLGSILGQGFTFCAWVNTGVTNRQMNLVGGARIGGTNTTFNVTLNRAFNNTNTIVPHALRIYLKPEATLSSALEYSVLLDSLPTGSLCDGRWHHLAITVPVFYYAINAAYPHFYFDGIEACSVQGSENILYDNLFSDFTDTGFRIGADGSTNPASFFSGALDEVAIFSTELTADDIADLVAAQAPILPPAFMAATNSPQADGVPNLLKYALGLDPLAAVNPGVGQPSATLSGHTLNYRFPRMAYATDITYHVDKRTNLMSGFWTEVWNSTTNPYSGSVDGFPVDTTRSTNGGDFFRLRITQP